MAGFDNLLVSVTLPGAGEIAAGGLVVIVGPNSSGKTQLLRDIYNTIIGQQRQFVVCDKIHINRPTDFGAFVDSFVERGALRKTVIEGRIRLDSRVPHFGIGQPGTGDTTFEDAQSWYKAFDGGDFTKDTGGHPFLRHFGPLLSTALFLENRLVATNQTGSFDYVSQKPSNDLQALHLDSVARDRLNSEMSEIFGKAVRLDPSRGGILALRVAELPEPSPWDWASPDKVSRLRGIDTEGDGLKSYCATCVALLLGERPVCLIDEPELCLHPPQAHALGRFIGEYGTSATTATFVATHSSQVLRGILETASKLRIVRLTRAREGFVARLVDEAIIKDSLRRPSVRSEVVLDGIFADYVTIVEADTDRVAYSAAFGLVPRSRRRANYLAGVGGTGGIAETARFYRALRIPATAVADLDLIRQPDNLRRIIDALTGEDAGTTLADEAKQLIDAVQKMPPSIDEQTTCKKLSELAAEHQLDWTKRDDERIGKELRLLANSLDRLRPLKGGIAAFHSTPELASRVRTFLETCKAKGLFLVPVGELEQWSPALMKDGPSRERKSEWANEFVRRMVEDQTNASDVLSFVSEIVSFHEANLESLTSTS